MSFTELSDDLPHPHFSSSCSEISNAPSVFCKPRSSISSLSDLVRNLDPRTPFHSEGDLCLTLEDDPILRHLADSSSPFNPLHISGMLPALRRRKIYHNISGGSAVAIPIIHGSTVPPMLGSIEVYRLSPLSEQLCPSEAGMIQGLSRDIAASAALCHHLLQTADSSTRRHRD